MSEIDELVQAFNAGLDGRDPAGLEAVFAPGALVWHNNDRNEVDAVGNMAAIAMLAQLVNDLRCESIYVAPTPEGFVYRFVVHGTVASNGKPFEMQNCIFATTSDGKFTRIDEYLDPTLGAQFA
jgi:ketosteroid isomerase-like protein